MTHPTRSGLRRITVAGKTYRWRFDGVIIVTAADRSNGQQLLVDFGYFDAFLYLNDSMNRPPDFEPKVVMPRFVAAAIKFAVSAGWAPNDPRPPLRVDYRKDLGFSVAS